MLLGLFQLQPLGALSVGSYGPVVMGFYFSFYLFLSTSFLFGTARCSRLIMYISCPVQESPFLHFFNEPSSLLLDNSTRNQNLDAEWLKLL